MKKITGILVVGLVLWSLPAQATKSAAMLGDMAREGCNMTENVTMSIRFNGSVDKAATIKSLIDETEDEIRNFATEMGMEKVSVTSRNFSINMNYNNGDDYQYSGSIGLKLSPYSKSLELLDKLKEKSYKVSLNVNSYNRGNCNQ